MFDFNSNEGYFLHLLKCALKNEQPNEAPDEIDFKKIYEISCRHDVENITFLSIDKLDDRIEDGLYRVWQEAYYKRINHCAVQTIALEELIEAFTSKGIDCMPLKGSIVRNYYPEPDLRCMSDIDFLVKEQNRQVVRDIMHSLGYEDDILDDGNVDAFKRGNLVYIEVHYDFSDQYHAYHELFTIDWNKLQPTKTEHLYEMDFEDLYFFNVGHYAKNMHNKGMGLRGVVDGYVLWNKLSTEQQQRIFDRFAQTELDDFHNKLLKIADIWFEDAKDDGKLDAVQEYLMSRLTYGDEKTLRVLQTMYSEQTSSNTGYIWNKIFPSVEYLYRRFNIKHRCFLLLPFLWIARIFSQLFGSKEKWNYAKRQVDVFKTIDQADIDYERKIRQDFGLM